MPAMSIWISVMQSFKGTYCAVRAATASPNPRYAASSSIDSSSQLQSNTLQSALENLIVAVRIPEDLELGFHSTALN